MKRTALMDTPAAWTWTTLEDASLGVYDCPHSTPVYAESGPYIARTQDVATGIFRPDGAAHVSDETYQERITRAEPRFGDLLYSREGTYFGFAAEVPPQTQVCLGQRMVLIRPREELLDHRFARYWLNSEPMRAFVRAHSDGSVAQRLNLPVIRAIPVPLPPLAVQRSIADTLAALDDKIESNQRAIAKILELAETTYFAACVEGPRFVSVGEVAEFQNRRRVPLSSRERDERPGPYPYYGATGVFGFIDDFLFDEILTLVGEDGSVVNKDGTPVTQYIWGKSWINNHAHPLTGRGLSTELLFLALRSSDVRPIVTGAVQPKISMGNLKNLLIMLPAAEKTAALVEGLSPLFAIYRQRADEIRRLQIMRDTLLPELLAGRMRIHEATEAIA